MSSAKPGVNRPLRPMIYRLVSIGLMLLITFVCAQNVSARGGFRGGGFRFSGGYRSLGGFRSSRSPAGSFFRWGSARRRSTAGSWGRARTPVNTATAIGGSRAAMATERSLYTTARREGTLFSTRQEAERAFRARYAGEYTSRFASRPATRPAYIPAMTTVAGKRVNIVYNARMGGYGFVDPALGRWVFYNALTNAAMMNTMMASHYYWWGPPPVYYATAGTGFFNWALLLFFAFVVMSGLLRFLGRAVRNRW